jgi:hypothetical protein
MLDVDEELISFGSGSPRASVRMVKETMTPKEEEGKTDRELLEFYRERCRAFQEERQTMLDRLTHLEVSSYLTSVLQPFIFYFYCYYVDLKGRIPSY